MSRQWPGTGQEIVSGADVSLRARTLCVDLPLITALWVCAAVYAVVLLPLSIAGLGVRDVTLIKFFALWGLAPQLAVALRVLLFADPPLNALVGGIGQITSSIGGARKPA